MLMHTHRLIHELAKSKKPKTPFDKFIVAASFVYPATAIPQIIQVFSSQCQGVSAVSYISYTVFSLLFLVYGIRNDVMPMVINYALWTVVNGLVVIGALACVRA